MRQIMKPASVAREQTGAAQDPLARSRRTLRRMDVGRLMELEASIRTEIHQIAAAALRSEGGTA
jgi:hypothetical protein